MNCNEFDNYLSLYIDDKLTKEQETEFLAHKEQCEHCFRALQNAETMNVGMEELRDLKAPEDLSKNVIRALRLEQSSSFENVQKNEQKNVQKSQQPGRKAPSGNGRLLPKLSWVKRVALAAVMVLIVTSAVILSTDWLPRPVEDMVTMDSTEEGASIMDEQESAMGDPAREQERADGEEELFTSEEEYDEDTADGAERPIETDEAGPETPEFFGGETLGITYGEWLVILLGFGVIGVILILRRNRN